MIEVLVRDREGKEVDKLSFDEACLGGSVNYELMHRAIVMYEANQRLGTAAVKPLRAIIGHSKKPFAQKGTGRARQGSVRRVGSRKGAVAHGPNPHDCSLSMPKAERRAALKSALLGKFLDGEVLVVSDLKVSQPKTKPVVSTLNALNAAKKSCLVVSNAHDQMLYKSVRNIKNTSLLPVSDLNCYVVLRHKNLLFTRAALETFLGEEK